MKFSVNDFVALDFNGLVATNGGSGSCSSYSGVSGTSTSNGQGYSVTSSHPGNTHVAIRTGSCSGTQNGEALLGSPKFMCNFPGNTANHDGVIVGTAPIATYQNQNVVLFADKLTA